jgi:hypothetical protein
MGKLPAAECRYAAAVLGEEITKNSRNHLEEIRRPLLAIIPRERGKTMK